MSGSLQIKNGKYYAVISYKNEQGKRKQKWVNTNLEAKGNKRKAEDFLKTHKKGDKIFDNALKATHKMKKDIKVASFAKWGAIVALGLSILPNILPSKKQKETTEA